jgi:hypothetical protein
MGGGGKTKKKMYSQKKIRKKKIFPGIVQKKIPSLEDRPINFNLKKKISSHQVRKNIYFFYMCKKKKILPLKKPPPPPPITFLMVRP